MVGGDGIGPTDHGRGGGIRGCRRRVERPLLDSAGGEGEKDTTGLSVRFDLRGEDRNDGDELAAGRQWQSSEGDKGSETRRAARQRVVEQVGDDGRLLTLPGPRHGAAQGRAAWRQWPWSPL